RSDSGCRGLFQDREDLPATGGDGRESPRDSRRGAAAPGAGGIATRGSTGQGKMNRPVGAVAREGSGGIRPARGGGRGRAGLRRRSPGVATTSGEADDRPETVR